MVNKLNKVQQILDSECTCLHYFTSDNELYEITGYNNRLYANSVCIEYDYNFSLDDNLQALYDAVVVYELETYGNVGL